MQSHYSSNSSQSLEAEFAQVSQQHNRREKIKTTLQQSLTALLNFLTGAQTLTVRSRRIKNKQHPNGKTQWIVCDPHNEQYQVFDSQQAVQTWLEQRYYR